MCRTNVASWRLIISACIAAFAIAMTAAFYPDGEPLFVATQGWILSALAWILAQSVVLMLPGLLAALCIAKYRPQASVWLGSVWFFGIGLIVLCDAVMYHWIAERFLSRKTLAIAGELTVGLAAHVPSSTCWVALRLIGGFLVFATASWWIAKIAANQFVCRRPAASMRMTLLSMIGFTIALAAPAMWNLRTTRDTMHNHSACFPLCAFHIVRSATSAPTEIVAVPPMAVQSIDAFVQNLQRRRENAAVTIQSDHRPDIVLVIIESMRPELVDEQTMPTLCRYAQKGIHCQRHFSTGNATSHGIFGLFNGTDATLYSQFSSDESLLTRLFHQAGYELGFFAGHNDWQEFRMDGFVNADHFDRFQIEECDWLKSDRRATLRAKAFLDESDRPPRLAVLYLYSTHADYHSYPQDQIFQPAADDRFLIPYSLRDKPAVWNRYRNSAHFVDRCLDAVLADDRVVIVTGDHGESFLEDGVCGHGTRISKFQNMTPAVIYVPGGIPKTISEPTSHADLLPTVLAAADMIVDDETLLTGQNLGAITQSRLAKRFVVTRDYLTNELALVASHFADESNVFAIRFQFSPADGTTKILGAIDASGNQTATSLGLSERLVPQWIIDRLEWKHPR